MTPEEQAVIDAAIERFPFWIADETDTADLDISIAVSALLAAREAEENFQRQQEDALNPDPEPDYIEFMKISDNPFPSEPKMPENTQLNANEQLAAATYERFSPVADPWAAADEPAENPAVWVWHPRTWRDVRTGDTVRMPGTDITADISSAALQSWHVDPRGNTYHPQPLEHEVMRVVFDGQAKHKDMNPDAPVEINMTRAEITICNSIENGWESRE